MRSNRLDGISTKHGLKGTLEGKDYKALDAVLPFIAAFSERCVIYEASAPPQKYLQCTASVVVG